MLSVAPMNSSHAASGYYKAEGYYIKGTPEAENSAIYHGKGAEEAGLTGQVDDQKFAALLDGQAPNGQLLGRYQGGERQHRAGIDLTFSAPKSVSILALIGGDQRLIQAHTEAVKVALDYAEANLIETRRQVNGEKIRETGGKIIAGLFQHDTSRALDVHLHTHAAVTNIIKDSLGTYRSMSNEKFFERGKIDGRVSTTIFLGQLYRNALAEKVEEIGFQIDPRDKGLWELKGVPQALMDQMSKRSQEINAALEERGMEKNTNNSQLAALATRATKQPVERTELLAAWNAEVKELGLNMNEILHTSQTGKPLEAVLDKQALTERAVTYAVAHHSERNSIYARAALIDTAMKYSPTVQAKAVDAELSRLVEGGALFTMERKEGQYMTDVVNVRLEKENIHLISGQTNRPALDMRSKFDKVRTRSSDSAVAQKLRDTTLTQGQKDAVALALSSNGGVVGIQGYAGTGKTYALATANRMAEARGYTIEGIAPSHKAVAALSEAVPNSATVESTLIRHESGANLGDKSRTILVVDEASMLSSEGMNRLLRMSKGAGYARVVLVGDIKQLEAVGAGSAFRSLQAAGMETALMADIQRQRTEDGRETVLAAIKGDIKKAMSGISEISEMGGKDSAEIRANIAAKLADTYSALSPSAREEHGIIVLTNDMRKDVNTAVQHTLKMSGEIGGQAAEITSLVPKNFSQAAAADVRSFKRGDIVVAPIAPRNSGLKATTLYSVAGIDRNTETLTLAATDGSKVDVDLNWKNRSRQRLVVFGSETQTFYEGDRVKFKITDRQHGIVNSSEGALQKVTASDLTIKTDDGETLTMPKTSLAAKGMNLAYATTAHDFQGSSVSTPLIGMSSEELLSTEKSFYVNISRMRDNVHLVTDDVGKLTARIERETGERVDALDALEEERKRTGQGYQTPAESTVRAVLGDRDRGSETPEPSSETKHQDPSKERSENTQNKDQKTEAEKDDNGKDRQLSLLDTINAQIERDQKTRDERSR